MIASCSLVIPSPAKTGGKAAGARAAGGARLAPGAHAFSFPFLLLNTRSPKEIANSSHQRLNQTTLSADISAGRLITISWELNALLTGVRSSDEGFGQLTTTLFLRLNGRVAPSRASFEKQKYYTLVLNVNFHIYLLYYFRNINKIHVCVCSFFLPI